MAPAVCFKHLEVTILTTNCTIGNLNGKGDQASSVEGGNGCTTFFR